MFFLFPFIVHRRLLFLFLGCIWNNFLDYCLIKQFYSSLNSPGFEIDPANIRGVSYF